MAKTQAQWFTILKRWVPDWFMETEQTQVAHFQALAKVLAQTELTLEDHIGETFICQSEALFLDEHALERNITRLQLELDAVLCDRVRNLVNTSDPISIKSLVDGMLINGESTIVEYDDNRVFLNRETFINRGIAFSEIFYNFFTIIIDQQIRYPESFADREFFFNREDVYGQDETSLSLLQAIVEAVNRAKAYGVLYRLIERTT